MFINKKDLLQYIDPFDTDVEDYQVEILNYLLNVVKNIHTVMARYISVKVVAW